MKKKSLLAMISVPFLFFQACTTDAGYDPSKDYSNKEASYKVEDLYEMPYCRKNLESMVVYAEWEGYDFVCSEGFWVKLRHNENGSKLDDLPESYYSNDNDGDDDNGGNSSRLDYQTSTMTDSRDGKTYKTVTIGNQTWMAENLAYKTLYSFEYDWPIDDMKMGLFYDWDYAVYGGLNKRDICPSGWHLPSKNEWSQLIEHVGGKEYAFNLKSKDYWDYESGVTSGVDKYGFSAVPAGYREDGQNYIQQGYSLAAFWTSDGYDGGETYAYACMMSSASDKITLPTEQIYSYLNVRCIKD